VRVFLFFCTYISERLFLRCLHGAEKRKERDTEKEMT
jgi:hypothetical protein